MSKERATFRSFNEDRPYSGDYFCNDSQPGGMPVWAQEAIKSNYEVFISILKKEIKKGTQINCKDRWGDNIASKICYYDEITDGAQKLGYLLNIQNLLNKSYYFSPFDLVQVIHTRDDKTEPYISIGGSNWNPYYCTRISLYKLLRDDRGDKKNTDSNDKKFAILKKCWSSRVEDILDSSNCSEIKVFELNSILDLEMFTDFIENYNTSELKDTFKKIFRSGLLNLDNIKSSLEVLPVEILRPLEGADYEHTAYDHSKRKSSIKKEQVKLKILYCLFKNDVINDDKDSFKDHFISATKVWGCSDEEIKSLIQSVVDSCNGTEITPLARHILGFIGDHSFNSELAE